MFSSQNQMYLIIGNHLIILDAWSHVSLFQASKQGKADEVSLKSSSSGSSGSSSNSTSFSSSSSSCSQSSCSSWIYVHSVCRWNCRMTIQYSYKIASSRAKCGVLSFLLAFSMLAFVKACMCMNNIVIVLLWVIWEAKVKPDNMM